MKKLLILFTVFITTQFSYAQKKQAVNVFLHGQASFMPYGLFKEYTGAGFGAGLQAVLNSKHKLKPQLDATVHFFSTNKILFVFENGQTTGPQGMFTTIFPGFVYTPGNRLELALSAGPSFDDDGTDFGIKPYVAYYLGKKKSLNVNTSLTHLFSPNQFSKKNTGIISAGIAVKLF